MSGKKAFTLVELLVVVAIIALLVSILLPTLGRAKEMARKAVCASTMSGHGKAMLMYVTDNKAYPLFSPAAFGSMTGGVYLYPKFYGVLQANKIQAGRPSAHFSGPPAWGGPNYGPWAGQPLNAAWPGCWCPNFDWAATFKNALAAGGGGVGSGNYTYWASAHPLAMSYQWNVDLRTGAGGRYSNRLNSQNISPGYWWQWFDGRVTRADGTTYWTQAVSPDEIKSPGLVIESWDGWDLGSAPNINWATYTSGGMMTPGINAGPYIVNGRPILNGFRHRGSPNILYADGHLKADATRVVDPAADGLGGIYAGLNAYSYADWDPVWGNLEHIVPRVEVE